MYIYRERHMHVHIHIHLNLHIHIHVHIRTLNLLNLILQLSFNSTYIHPRLVLVFWCTLQRQDRPSKYFQPEIPELRLGHVPAKWLFDGPSFLPRGSNHRPLSPRQAKAEACRCFALILQLTLSTYLRFHPYICLSL